MLHYNMNPDECVCVCVCVCIYTVPVVTLDIFYDDLINVGKIDVKYGIYYYL